MNVTLVDDCVALSALAARGLPRKAGGGRLSEASVPQHTHTHTLLRNIGSLHPPSLTTEPLAMAEGRARADEAAQPGRLSWGWTSLVRDSLGVMDAH